MLKIYQELKLFVDTCYFLEIKMEYKRYYKITIRIVQLRIRKKIQYYSMM